jgi:RNA polymerase sigma-70 factor (ECF subfamily)
MRGGRGARLRAVDADLELLARWRADDAGAGEQLCRRYFTEIYRFFEYKLPGEADDLTQQTFLSCVKAREQFRGASSFRTYLFTIAKNVFYMRLRQRPKHEHVDLDASSLDELVSSPSQQLGREQELARVRAALRRLPVSQQVLLELSYWHDLDAAALAEVFETSPGAIRVRLLRARRALRAGLETDGGLPAGADRLSSSLAEPDPELGLAD